MSELDASVIEAMNALASLEAVVGDCCDYCDGKISMDEYIARWEDRKALEAERADQRQGMGG